jgi:hypothetical protein
LRVLIQTTLAIFVFCFSARSQQLISVGVKGGVPLTDFYSNTAYPQQVSELFVSPTRSFNASRNYVVGAVVELRLPLHLSLEIDGLYRPLSLTYEYNEFVPSEHMAANSDSWEFPVLGKYRFTNGRITPFIDGGPSLRLISQPRGRFLSKNGTAVGAGLDIHLLHIRVEPEVRYTYWTRDPAVGTAAHLASRHNQAELVVGLLF